MTYDLEFWKRVERAVDPLRLPEPDVFLDRYQARQGGPAARILDDLELLDDPTTLRVLLCGARGSGKTTELVYLHRKLAETPGLASLYVDIAAAIPESAGTAVWLPLVAAAVRHARGSVQAAGGDRLVAALGAVGFGADAMTSLLQYIGAVTSFAGGAGSGALAAVIGAAQPTARALAELARLTKGRLEQANEAEPSEVDALSEALREEIGLLQEETGSRLILLLDGFDRRRSAESVLHALEDADLLYDLPAGLVLSGPVQMRFDPKFSALNLPSAFRHLTLANLPVVTPGGDDDPSGQLVLEQLLRSRLAHDAVAAALFPPELVRKAARASSGIPREFLELIRLTARSCRSAGRERAEQADLDDAIKARRHAYQAGLTSETWDVLQAVLTTRERPRGALDDLLFVNHVACYPNGDVWFRPNELLVDYLRERIARAEREA